MTERPILFSAPMVSATLRDVSPKEQTRRPVTRLLGFGPVTEFQRSDTAGYMWMFRDRRKLWHDIEHRRLIESCPYGAVGDRLWGRETLAYDSERGHYYAAIGTTSLGNPSGRQYVDYDMEIPAMGLPARSIPSIHMPRWASRILLEVTAVRVERLQDISEGDAIAEGLVEQRGGGWGLPDGSHFHGADPRISYWSLWEAINGPGSVEANPLVWVVEFTRQEAK